MLKQASLYALEKAINQALKLDPAMPEKLKAFEGKVIQIILQPLNLSFYQCFLGGEIKLCAKYEGEPNTVITSSPLGLIRLSLLPPNKARSLFNDKIKIKGDVELGQALKKLFDEMDIDWEGHLAHFTGDVIAHQLSNFAQAGKQWGKHFKQSMQDNVTEFLQQEAQTLPCREEIEDFMADVDSLRLDVDRLEAKVKQVIDEAN